MISVWSTSGMMSIREKPWASAFSAIRAGSDPEAMSLITTGSPDAGDLRQVRAGAAGPVQEELLAPGRVGRVGGHHVPALPALPEGDHQREPGLEGVGYLPGDAVQRRGQISRAGHRLGDLPEGVQLHDAPAQRLLGLRGDGDVLVDAAKAEQARRSRRGWGRRR